MQEIIKLISDTQNKYLLSKEKDYIKNNSQFFTPDDIAYKLVSTLDLSQFKNNTNISILEPSAGCGMLILPLISRIKNELPNVTTITLDAYEYDSEVAYILRKNIKLIKRYFNKIIIKTRVINKNFIIHNSNKWSKKSSGKYDIVISNPPYKKINQTSIESTIMKEIVYGQPNIYTLFIAMSLKLLNHNGICAILSPRNYLTGEYSNLLRKFIFNNYSIIHIHSFKRGLLFPSVNQEVVITTYMNRKNVENVNISFNDDVSFKTSFNSILLDNVSFSVGIPKSINDINTLKNFSLLSHSLYDLGFNINVGPIVQFRNSDDLNKNTFNKNFAPLLIAPDIQHNNKIIYWERENKRKTHNKSISITNKHLIKNFNYLLLRKVSAKNDDSLIVCSVYRNSFFDSPLLGLDNNLLYFSKLNNKSLTLYECYGLYCYINSKQFLSLYSIINGTHTINVTDFSKIKFPSHDQLITLGKCILNENSYTRETCTHLVATHLYLIV
ncbi:Eco57I restriction-modification methylase domain-containing protein [Clostridium culturomicium]|uniref:Eco57I restriction-modification methylase domain-containing protein n=1 Tax=Clostridium culturomicium TaxID=1499683 RepID=UPI00385728EC